MVARLVTACRVISLAALVFALGGCLNIKSGLEVHTDDTVSGQLVVFAPKTELTTNGRTQEQGFAAYRKNVPPLPKGTEVPYDDGTNYGTQITYTNTPLSEFTGNLKISRSGNRYTFSMQLDPTVLAGTVAGGNVDTAKLLVKTTSLEISVTLPGSIVAGQTNGTVIGQNSVVWNFAANVDKPAQLTAVSEVPASPSAPGRTAGSGTPWLLILGILVVLLLAAVAVVLVLLLRRRGPART
jgi:phosphatidylinositol mannoside-binding LppM-like protein